MYKCKYCGKEFESPQKLGGHIIRCKLNPNYNQNIKNCNGFSKYNKIKRISDTVIYYCKYCGKQCKGKNSLVQHEIRCKENSNKIKSGIEYYNESKHEVWNKGLTKLQHASILAQSLKVTGIESPNKGIKMSDEQKKKIRLSTIKYIEKTNGSFRCRYNINACKFIDKLNIENNWNLQHAENGGEIQVDGYFLDGYDKKLNIVFEYDEPTHYIDPLNNILKDKDICRQNYIINKLQCKFFRYNEYIDLLYEVT